MKDELYKIGEVSDIFNVSVQTLRFYEKIGLFSPALIEESTGYRYYSWEQFERLRNILFLRDFGLPLKDIKHQLNIEHSAEYKELLKKYSQTLEQRIREDIQLKKYIDQKIESLELARYLPKNKTIFLIYPSLKALKHECVIGSRATFKDMQLTIAGLIAKYHLKAVSRASDSFFSRMRSQMKAEALSRVAFS
jgi:DNA-binding transcriptional MerR regulator